jgi:hypothetical protein
MGTTTASAARDLVVDVAAEAVKKVFWPDKK